MSAPTVLYIGAHDVDFLVRAGGTLARYADEGSRVVAISLTLGERQESQRLWLERPEITLEEVIETRHAEALRCAELIGCTFRWLGWEDCPITIDRARHVELMRLIQEIRPDILMTHWPDEVTNFDHLNTGHAVREAAMRTPSAGTKVDTGLEHWTVPALYFTEPTFPLPDRNGFSPNVWIDITDVYERKLAGLKAAWSHGRLDLTYPLCAEFRAAQARMYTGNDAIRYAEAFVADTPWVGRRLPFEGGMQDA
jgi:4-oxalomesaconate hydratase